MGTSAKHHYVPKAILRNFRVRGDSVFYASRKNSMPEPRNIDSIFRRIRYNSFQKKDGSHDDTVERFFAEELDNYIPGWVDQFNASSSSKVINFGQKASRERFVQFFYNHIKRTPDFIEPIIANVKVDVFSKDLVQEYEAQHRPATEEETELLRNEDFQTRILANTRVENFSRQSQKILNVLASMRIVVARPDNPKKTFIVASNPVARFEDHPSQPIGEPGVELWTTMSPTLAVGFVAVDMKDSNMSLSDHLVRKLNTCLTLNSHAIAGNSEKLISSLTASEW